MGNSRIRDAWRSAFLVLLLCGAVTKPSFAASDPEAGDDGSTAQIAKLITELGAEQYVQREKAQEQLQRLGLRAFDALLDAQYHEDIEIALRARYLLRSMPISWADVRDTPEVRDIMRSYEEGGREERLNRMEQLALLEDSQGVPALCRLTRFETDRVLSKQAALLVMNHAAPGDAERRSAVSQRIRTEVGNSRRPASGWLKNYARTLEDGAGNLAEWHQIVQTEETTLARFPDHTDRRVVRDLLRWFAELLLKLEQRDEAESMIRRVAQYLENDRHELFDVLDWSLDREAWFVADLLAERFPESFQQEPLLLYRWAEAQRKHGNTASADETAQRALELDADNLERHIETARRLTDRMLYDWAESEFRQTIEKCPADDETGLEARLYLSDLLFDLERLLESAEVMQAAVEAVDADMKLLQNFGHSPGELRARMHYRFAMHLASQGDHSQQRERLAQAIDDNQYDIDVLIAMHRLPEADADWRKDTLERIRAVAGKLLDVTRRYEEIVESPATERMRGEVERHLASYYNQFAWLVANTQGDYQEALRASHRSLVLSPDNPSYLDTLGRCYYAVGDLKNAVKYQKRAVRLEPYTQTMRRQLKLFQEELAASQDQKPAS
jgi:tetratricopeptide (TPR) repeat protein